VGHANPADRRATSFALRPAVHVHAFDEHLLGRRVGRDQLGDLVEEAVEGQGVVVHLVMAGGRDGRGDELRHGDTGGGELCAQRLRVGVHAGLRGRVAEHQRQRQEDDARSDRHQVAVRARSGAG